MHSRQSRADPVQPVKRPMDAPAYSYLLGMYLGDGSIALTQKGHVFIRFTLDRKYRGLPESAQSRSLTRAGAS